MYTTYTVYTIRTYVHGYDCLEFVCVHVCSYACMCVYVCVCTYVHVYFEDPTTFTDSTIYTLLPMIQVTTVV